LNHEQALVQRSTDGGATWSTPVNGAEGADRPDFPAIAIAPDGRDLYLVYDGFRDPWQTDTTSPRRFQGVVRHADVGAEARLGRFVTLQRGAAGDARSSSANALTAEFLGDYNDAAATNDAGIAVWNDARDGQVCDAINSYRAALANPNPPAAPDPLTACPARFGNSDIFGGSDADPSPDAAAATRQSPGKPAHTGPDRHHRAPPHKHRPR
jgi:hypothetical protein